MTYFIQVLAGLLAVAAAVIGYFAFEAGKDKIFIMDVGLVIFNLGLFALQIWIRQQHNDS